MFIVVGWVIRELSYPCCCSCGIDVGIEVVEDALVVSEKEKDARGLFVKYFDCVEPCHCPILFREFRASTRFSGKRSLRL